jgi:hypothetical protein
MGPIFDAYFGSEEGICGSELAAGVGAGDKQPGSNAKARRSLAVDHHVSLESLLGARREATQAGGGSQPGDRHGLAAEVQMIDRPH